MNIHRSLAEASLYRAVALIPEQAAFGLALATSQERTNPETRRSLELGLRFCELFLNVAHERASETESEQDAAIVFGLTELLKELDASELRNWSSSIDEVRSTIGALLTNEDATTANVAKAGKILRSFATTARQNVALVSEGELLRRVWV